MIFPKRVMFLTASIGCGHIKAAEAIGKVMQLNREIAIQYIDVLHYVNASVVRMCMHLYLTILAKLPKVYDKAYTLGNESKIFLYIMKKIAFWGAKGLKKKIMEERPCVVICTHALGAAIMDCLHTTFAVKIPYVCVVTDFTVHRFWLQNSASDYFVADTSLYMQMDLTKQQRWHSFGIPVDKKFAKKLNKIDVRRKYHIPTNAKVILIMGGGIGIFPAKEVFKSLVRMKQNFYFIIIAGKNQRLYQQLKEISRHVEQRILLTGFVENVHEYMAAADVLISKAGGLSVSEALCVNLPMIIYQPFPGQETRNVTFLTSRNLAFAVKNSDSLKKIIDKIFRIESNVCINMKINGKKFAKPDSSAEIAAYIINKFCKS